MGGRPCNVSGELEIQVDAAQVEEFVRSLAEVERAHIEDVLRKVDGNLSAAARALGLHRRTLQRKCYKLGILRPASRAARKVVW